MINKTKIALIASVAMLGMATSAFAQASYGIPVYRLPSELPSFGAPAATQTRQAVAPSRPLYNAVVVPNAVSGDDLSAGGGAIGR
jgi:hypothetical protein